MADDTAKMMKAALLKAQEDLRRTQSETQQTIDSLRKELESVKSSKTPNPRGQGLTPRNLNLDDSSTSEDEDEGNETRSDEEEEEADPAAKKMAQMESQNKKILRMLAKLPGALTPVAEESPIGYAQSPFVDEIARARIPKKINVSQPHKLYDGAVDPYDHVAQYKQKMWTLSIPEHLLEATMCKSFGATLSGPALQWLISLKPGNIPNFAALINKFYLQFASSRVLEKHTGDLYRITQKSNEAVRQYLDRFNKEMISVKSLDIPTAIEAFRRGLTYKSRLYYELTRYPCSTFEEVRARAMAEIRVEEDEVSSVASKAAGKSTDNEYPSIASYCFNVDAGGVVNALEKLGTTARWPRKSGRPNSEKDTNKWCSYHGDHGHRTEDVAWLLKKGYLEHLMGKKGQQEDKSGPSQQQSRPPPEPTHDKVINSIFGGSKICGLTYSAAKRFAREGSKAVPKQYRSTEEKKLRSMTINFDEEDGDEEADHHDGLVVSLTVSNCLMKRVLIDNGSSTNIIFKSALESMGL
ncbi:uncharacterized protein LOC104896471 [Beta vulgaris subsp. vulgaris]|uniref:uncharacterized protein LOC104896471 n=1 Tax=Beta vulgaris subsp. vulgaris TaxID=3555 RepID=UPI002037239D|nr:uncharacterized protein LOC104896471 [Beta vulgaris subsp. vulgaris]